MPQTFGWPTGVAVDLSKYAARRAARVHPQIGLVVADISIRIPVRDASVALALDIFAPRNAPEHRQTIRRDGALLVGTPLTSHLAELRHALGLFNIDSRKDARIAHAFAPYFRSFEHSSLTLQMSLNAEDVLSLARMGPSARHIDL